MAPPDGIPNGINVTERPVLSDPVLIVMLQGWIDAAGAAAAAMAHIESLSPVRTIATFEPDLFIDYRARRPVVELRDGVSTRLVWPTIELKVAKDSAGRDLLLLTGFEPDANWRAFTDTVARLSQELGVRMMVGLGAYPFAMPHTRASRLSCTTPSIELAESVPYLRNSVDVPGGVAAVLEHAFHQRGIPAIGIWAQVPHYISTMSYPGATAALLYGLASTAGLTFDTGDLERQAGVQSKRLDELVEANPEHVAMLRQLELAYDAMAPGQPGVSGALTAGELPSGDELAAEVERFLREQNG